MSSPRHLKNKIRVVGNIKQITRAMEMVAATKMRKAQEVALRARPYAKKSFALLLHVLKQADKEVLESIFWTDDRKKEKIALVVITSDKGLAGSFNSSVLRAASRWKQEQESGGGPTAAIDIVAVGKKGRDFFRARGAAIAAEFFQFSDIVQLLDITPLMDWILGAYEQKRYEKIVFCSQRFISALTQKPAIQQVLPLEQRELQKIIENITPKTGRYADYKDESDAMAETTQYLLEPTAKEILDSLIRDLIRVMIVHLVFESNASEHSARMLAMKSATDNAQDLQEELQLLLNKARQGAITQELSEIVSAKEALVNE